ncbi:MAG: RidA family protein [Candidatus Limnocylindrales bacterium]
MRKQAITTDRAPRPAGGYSQAIVAAGQIWVSGQVGIDPDTGAVAGDDVATQTGQALANIAAVLAEAGATLADVVSVTVFLDSMDDFDAFDAAYRRLVPDPKPARATVGVSIAPLKVEIQATAVLPGGH